MKNICHITTVHPRYDTRIFEKFAKSLSKKYEVLLIVSDGLGNETISNTFLSNFPQTSSYALYILEFSHTMVQRII